MKQEVYKEIRMIQSMTAFARAQDKNIICEIRSINHRYLEISIRLPDFLQELEMLIRESIARVIKRGKIECIFRYHQEVTVNSFAINKPLAQQVCNAANQLIEMTQSASVNIIDMLKWPGILQVEEHNNKAIQKELLQLLEQVLQELVASRQREGKELKHLFTQRLLDMKKEVLHIRKRLPEILQTQRQRLRTRCAELKLEIDHDRLEQEIVILMQKMDVAEELERTETHILEVQRILQEGGVVGRRLDFLMQELNREANTLGAKSIDAETTRSSVELKVLIEQVREQVQNIE